MKTFLVCMFMLLSSYIVNAQLLLMDSDNSSTVLLTAGDTMTGYYNSTHYYDSIRVTAVSNGVGFIQVHFTTDTSSIDTVLYYNLRRVNANYYVANLSIPILYDYFRVRYINGNTDQNGFILSSYLVDKDYVKEVNEPPISGQIEYTNVRLINDIDLDYQSGKKVNYKTVNVTGIDDAVATAYGGLWGKFGDFDFPEELDHFYVQSASANDDSTGSNANRVVVEYLDDTWKEVSDTFYLQGEDTTVWSSRQAWRVNSMYVLDVGEFSNSNADSLMAVMANNGEIMAYVITDYGKSNMGKYTIPDDFVGFITDLEVIADSTVTVQLLARRNYPDGGFGPVTVLHEFSAVQGITKLNPGAYIELAERTDIYIRAKDADDASLVVGSLNLKLIRR